MIRFYRSLDDKKIAGIFGAIGEIFNFDPNVIRILAVVLLVMSGIFPLLITYLIAWAILPEGHYSEFNNRDAH